MNVVAPTAPAGLHFGLFEQKIVSGEMLLCRHLIVLKDRAGNIVKWTDFHKYARGSSKTVATNLLNDCKKQCSHAVQFLNYVFFERYHITKLTDLTADMVREFLKDYGLCRLPGDTENTHRGKSTVETCISHIMHFLENLVRDNPGCKLKVSSLYKKQTVFSKKKKRYITRMIPTFEVNYRQTTKHIFRDLPDRPFQILLGEIIRNHPNILMLVANCAFAGMRPSESCNVRRVDSPLGPGIQFDIFDGEVENVRIDLTEEKNLRSDRVPVGGIKKERWQKVYPSFLEMYVECYNYYMKYIEGHPYESEYGPLTTNRDGMAMTYDSFNLAFKKAVNAAIPLMLADDDPETVYYGHLLQENSIGPHILRHWFSVQLTLRGEDAAGLKYWRGDKSPESALAYLENKGELEKQYKKVNNELFNYAAWKADKLFG